MQKSSYLARFSQLRPHLGQVAVVQLHLVVGQIAVLVQICALHNTHQQKDGHGEATARRTRISSTGFPKKRATRSM